MTEGTFSIQIPPEYRDNELLLKVNKAPPNQEDSKYMSFAIPVTGGLISLDTGKHIQSYKLVEMLQEHGLTNLLPLQMALGSPNRVVGVDWASNKNKTSFKWDYCEKTLECNISASKKEKFIYIHIHTIDPIIATAIMQDLQQELFKRWVPWPPAPRKIYEWIPGYAAYKESKLEIPIVTQDDLVGLDSHFNCVFNDIKAITSKEELCKRLGADSGFNYLLEGLPGTGKSSFVKAVAHDLQLPVYIVKSGSLLNPNYISRVLCPQEDRFRLVLIEDFDRFLDSENGEKIISELLNALDGAYPALGTFRFFIANHPDRIAKNEAMYSRMRRVLSFGLPETENVYKHLLDIFPDNKTDVTTFCELIKDERLSLRVIKNYISHFIMDDNPIKSAINGYQAWLIQFKKRLIVV